MKPGAERAVELLVDGGEEVAVGAEAPLMVEWPMRSMIARGWAPLGDEERGVGVPQIMEPGSVREPGTNDGRFRKWRGYQLE